MDDYQRWCAQRRREERMGAGILLVAILMAFAIAMHVLAG